MTKFQNVELWRNRLNYIRLAPNRILNVLLGAPIIH
jgi:hypothetical protein